VLSHGGYEVVMVEEATKRERREIDVGWKKKRGEKPDFWPTLDLILFMLRP